ncbi:MAG: DUF362 domain-containing protein [Promethearchaeota archaeon]
MKNAVKSPVYFINTHAEDNEDRMTNKISKLFDAAGFGSLISKNDLTAIKLHFGEKGNSTFVPPWFIRSIVDKIKSAGGKPFLTDTNTLYNGSRKNAVDHLEIAKLHGFTPSTAGAPVIIADGITGRNYVSLKINKKYFKSVKVASDLVNADALIVSSHFKGHLMAGFGGAIKNLGMGGACIEGKKEQHSVRPFLADPELCTGCGTCVNVCPVGAITLVNEKSTIDSSMCIGCGECIAHCPEEALSLNWETEIPEFTERMVEYTYGLWKKHQGKIGFINFVINVTPECDCFGVSEPTIVRDIGILASIDPVALDKACYDLVNKQTGFSDSRLKNHHSPGEDKFTGLHESTRGDIQLSYGEELGIGNQDYNLIDLSEK